MTDSAVSSQLYHVAFQNTLTKAMVFIDRQLQGWTPMTKETNTTQLEPPLLTQPTRSNTTGTTPSLISDSYTSSLYTNQQYDNDDNYSFSSGSSSISSIQTPVSATPPPYFNEPQRTTRPRPMSMPILHSQQMAGPPPLYGANHTIDEEDPYTRATQKWQNRRSIAILPREEEGKEDLPEYHCSVYKTAKVNLKMEHCMAGQTTRSWRRVYIELWGTVLRVYPLTWLWSIKAKEPMFTLSLAGADASRAIDYMKRPFVLRLATDDTQCLVQTSNLDEMISWIEHLQAGINISLDLEDRPMPKFLTLQPRRGVDTGVLCGRMLEIERRREQRRRNQQEILA